MYSFKRSERVRGVMQREIASIIREDVKDPRIGFITVTAVDLAENLQHAKVYISPFGNELERKNSFKGIVSASKFIRSQLGKRMRIKKLPDIHFILDTLPAEADHINRIFHKIEENEGISDENDLNTDNIHESSK